MKARGQVAHSGCSYGCLLHPDHWLDISVPVGRIMKPVVDPAKHYRGVGGHSSLSKESGAKHVYRLLIATLPRCQRMDRDCLPSIPKPRKRRTVGDGDAVSPPFRPYVNTLESNVTPGAALRNDGEQEVLRRALLSRSDLSHQGSESFTNLFAQGLGIEAVSLDLATKCLAFAVSALILVRVPVTFSAGSITAMSRHALQYSASSSAVFHSSQCDLTLMLCR